MPDVTLTVAGTSFHQEAVRSLSKETPVKLEPDPENEYDPYAVKVITSGSKELIGYIPASLSRNFTDLITETGLIPEISIYSLDWYTNKVGRKTCGVVITIVYPKELE